jgi:glycosyltransferase involved in cell wall biosynthesis
MRIAVEGLGATVGPADGAGRYLLGLLGALARRDDVAVTAYIGPSMQEAVKTLDLAGVVVLPAERARRLVAQHSTVPREAARAGAEAVIYLGNYAPLRSGPPAVCVVANLLLAVADPGLGVSNAEHGRVDRARAVAFGRARAAYRRFARSQIDRRARVVVTISQTLADALAGVAPGLRGRIRVVRPPFNVAEVLSAPARRPPDAPAEYFLAVGRPWAYREYPLALAALAGSGLPHSLVVLGEAPAQERTPLEREARSLGLEGRIRFAALVDDPSLLRGWYEGAAALVATSRIEAFGYPLGEAMVLGTPVVAVRRTAFPEVVADAGLLVEPQPDALADALRQVVRPEERDRLSALGRRRAAAYSWDDCAAELLAICREVASPGPETLAGNV